MLALPAEPRRLRQRLLHDRGGVDKDLHLASASPRQPAGKVLELAFDDVMVVAVARVDRDVGGAPIVQQRQRILRRPVVQPQHDDGPHLRPQDERVGPSRLRSGEPIHVARVPGLDEGAQALRSLRDRVGRGDPAKIEAEGPGTRDERLFQSLGRAAIVRLRRAAQKSRFA